jgi:hypothetical protein
MLADLEARARAFIERCAGKDRLSDAEERDLREAMMLVRRSESIREDEARLRIRHGWTPSWRRGRSW